MGALRERLALPHVSRRRNLVAAVALDSLGTGIFLPFTVLYFAAETSISLAEIGVSLAVAAALSLPVAPLFGGWIDRFGPRPVVVVTNLLMFAAYLSYPALNAAWQITLAVFVVETADTVYWSAAGALAAEVADEGDLTRWYGMERMLRNVGYGIGGALGALLATEFSDGLLVVVLVNAASYAIAAILVMTWRAPRTSPASLLEELHEDQQETAAEPAAAASYRDVLRDRPFLVFVTAQFPLVLTLFVPSVLLPPFAVNVVGAPAWIPGTLMTVNTVLLVVLQPLVIKRFEYRARTRALQLCAVGWMAAFALFLLANTVLPTVILLVAMLVFTCAQLVGNTAGSPLLAALAPAHLRGRYMSVSAMAWSVSKIAAPGVLLTTLGASPALPWALLAAGCAATFLLVQWLHRTLPAHVVRESAPADKASVASAA
ncbi:MFS transporter [Streptomyces canus]